MRNDRLGLLMVAASLVVIAIVGGLVYHHQADVQRDRARAHGMAITRTVASVESGDEYAGPVADDDKRALMRSLVSIQDNADFSYLVLVSQAGEKLHEIVSPGSISPVAVMPREPFAWYGEHELASPGDGRRIREFFAPVLKHGQLAGFVRAGYYKNNNHLLGGQLPNVALTALPIFLLTVFSYFLIRREVKPLQALGEKMQSFSQSFSPGTAAVLHSADSGNFIQRVDGFIENVQARVNQLSAVAVSSQTTARLISYKHEKAESTLNALPDAILVLDNSGLPIFASQKLEGMLNRSREAIIGKPPQEWCDNREVLSFLLRQRQPAAALRAATLEFVPDGSPERLASLSVSPLLSPRDRDSVLGALFAFRDITREHVAKEAGVEFVSRVAHELKTPLQTLLAYSELLLERADLSEAQAVDALNVIHAEVGRMTALINNLLNISKMESGSLKLEQRRVKLRELIQDAFAGLRNQSLGRQIELELAVPPDMGSVRLDKELFRVAIDNLLSNAIKYSNPGGKVSVTASAAEDGEIQIRVRDEGIGISAEDCERIFAKHYRAANSETAARSGHGLGLYLAKQIIELHQGAINVSSEPGKGSEFVITLRARPMQLEASEAA
jgi:signal transduction histidine kinase